MSPTSHHQHDIISQKTNSIETEILLLWIIVVDVFNGFITELLHIYDNAEQAAIVSFVISLVIYFVIGLLSIGYGCLTSKCKCQNGLQCINILIKVFTFFGGICYFLGDNFHEVYKQDKRKAHITALAFLVIGVLCYRIIPSGIKRLHLQKYLKDTRKSNTSVTFNLCSPNDNETHSLTVAHTYLLTIVIDFDVWLTLVLQRADNNATHSHSLCNRMDEVAAVWSLYAGMIAIFISLEVMLIIMFIRKRFPTCNRWNATRKQHKCRDRLVCIWDCASVAGLIFATAAFLFADNKHLLDCYHVRTPIDEDEPEVRAALLAFAFTVFLAVTLGFYFRKLFRCVRVKGEILSVKALSDHQLQVYFQVKDRTENEENDTGIYSFTYNILTSEIIPSSECEHLNLHVYEKDIESALKYLGGVSNVKTAVHHENQNLRTSLHEIEDQPYLVVHPTDDIPLSTQVYKVRTMLTLPQDWIKDNHPIEEYTKDGIQYSIYLYRRGQNGNEESYAVLEKRPSINGGNLDASSKPVTNGGNNKHSNEEGVTIATCISKASPRDKTTDKSNTDEENPNPFPSINGRNLGASSRKDITMTTMNNTQTQV